MPKKLLFIFLFSAALTISAYLGFQEIQRAAADDNPGTDISSTNKYAWSDISEWWDFHYYHNVDVGTSTISGYASSSVGEISLDCATSPLGNICGTSNYKVTNPSGSGSLSGCGWNDSIGWVSFWCGDGNCDGSGTEDASSVCASSNYRVTIDANGLFNGYAWSDVDGWVSFNCANPGVCADSNYKVETSWRAGELTGTLESSIFDTQVVGGATLNSILWQGVQPAGTCVKFQIAVSENSSGPWNFWGPDAACDGSGDTNQYFGSSCPGPDSTIQISGCNRDWIKDNRYLRYRVILESDTAQSLTPRIDDIILNWSR
ncbi:MAG: hypothetical protein V2A55_02590 [Candidatus Jorgensenbacteria bacterium]